MNGKHLIIVGSGSALFSKKLSENHLNLSVSAVDINHGALEISKSTLKFGYLISFSGLFGDTDLLTDILEYVYVDKIPHRNCYPAPKGAKFFSLLRC